MKFRGFLLPIFLLLTAVGSQRVSAQSGSRLGCIDTALRSQAAAIKKHYTDQGFTVYRDAMISMSSMEPFPVIVGLQKGMLYQVIFVGSDKATRLKMEVLDGGDRKLDEKFTFKRNDPENYILYTYVPEQSDNYLFSIMQQWKSKDMCGSFCILRMDKPSASIVPYTGR